MQKKIQKMQNRAARIITGKLNEINRSETILQELGWHDTTYSTVHERISISYLKWSILICCKSTFHY